MSAGIAASECANSPAENRSASTGVLFDKALVKKRGIWNPDDLVFGGRCVLCSAESYRTVATRQDGLPIRECASCGLAYVHPRPSSRQLANYYGKGYFSGEKDFFKDRDYCLERDKSLRDGSVTGYRETVSNFNLKDKVILDIGCASGALLYLLREHHAKEEIGVDSAEYPISFGKAQYGLDLRCETLESANFPDEYFDLVTLIDVIEHIADLNGFFSELRRVLKTGGQLFLSTPNYFAHALTRDEWICLYQDFEHLQYFSKLSLETSCRRNGLRIVKCWTDAVPFRIHDYPTLHSYRLHQLVHPGIALRNARAKLKYKLVGRARSFAGLNLKAILSTS